VSLRDQYGIDHVIGSNSTGWGAYYIDLSNMLHDALFGAGQIGYGFPNISVGTPPPAVAPKGEGLPELVPEAPFEPPWYVPEPIDRRDIPPDIEKMSWADWAASGRALPFDWMAYPMASDHPGFIGAIPAPPVLDLGVPIQETDDVSWIDDLGDLVDIYDQITGPGDVLYNQDPGNATGSPTPDAPLVPAIAGVNCSTASPVWKKVCGTYKWVYPKRRRRKQLVTNGDAKGLAVLKGIVGVGKTMDTWIATHS